jgi:hypothetical protein
MMHGTDLRRAAGRNVRVRSPEAPKHHQASNANAQDQSKRRILVAAAENMSLSGVLLPPNAAPIIPSQIRLKPGQSSGLNAQRFMFKAR